MSLISSAVSLEYLNANLPSSIGLTAYDEDGSIVLVVLSGTRINFPQTSYNLGFTLSDSNRTITVQNDGYYYISYRISSSGSLGIGMSSSLEINGTEEPLLTRNPGLTTNEFSASGIVQLNAGDELELILSGLVATVTLQDNGSVINIIKVA